MEISLVENDTTGRWSSSIDYSAGDFTLVDISGNGAKLYRPTEINEFQQPDAMVEAISSMEDSKNYDFIEIKLAFRSVSKMNVYLHKDSFIKPVNPNDTTSNIFGKFSRGYIAGAMRVAVLDDETGELLMLWAPNSTYHLIDNQNGTYSFKTDSTPEENYSYYAEQEEGILEQVVSSEMYASKQFVVDSTGAEKEHAGNSPVLISLNPVSEGAYAEKRVRIRVWFEGTDREAHQALAGGNVNIKLLPKKLTRISRQPSIISLLRILLLAVWRPEWYFLQMDGLGRPPFPTEPLSRVVHPFM